jgi:DUF4097 and DUF4098 domain-containing protein YvlB
MKSNTLLGIAGIGNATLVAIATLSMTLTAGAVEPEIIEKSFDVKSGEKLHMKVDRGNIEVAAHDKNTVMLKITKTVKKASEERAEKLLADHKIEFAQESGVVKITAESPQKKTSFFGLLGGKKGNLSVHYKILVPENFNLTLDTSGGNVSIGDLEGVVQLRTSGGNIAVAAIDGPVNAHTSGGNMSVKSASGDIDLHTSGGNIKVDSGDGKIDARTSGGNIAIGSARGAVAVRTSRGNIHLGNLHNGNVKAKTSGGNVTAKLHTTPASDIELRTSGGTVTLYLPSDAKATFDAHASGGSVRCDLPVEREGKKSKRSLRGTLNGGGPTVTLKTSGGSVNIRKTDS